MGLPQNTQLGNLQMVEVYDYYDGPRLFLAANTGGQRYLAISVEDLQGGISRWLYAPISERRLRVLNDGSMDLRNAFVSVEDEFVFEVFTGASEDSAAPVKSSDLPDTELPMAGEFLASVDLESVSTAVDPVAPAIAKQTNRETVRFALSPKGISGYQAPSRLLGQALVAMQELVWAIGQAVDGIPTLRGKIDEDILLATEMRAVGAFQGSFGVELAPSIAPNLFGESTIADTLAELDRLLDAGSDEEALSAALSDLKPRVAKKYIGLVRLLAENDASVIIDWGSVSSKNQGGSYRRISAAQLDSISQTLLLTETAQSTTFSVTGILRGLNTRTRSFEMEERGSQNRIAGYADKNRFDSDDEFIINATYQATIEETVQVSGMTGAETVKRRLINLEAP